MTEYEALKELITQRFNATDARLDGLTVQVKETNGRLRGAETNIANMQPRLGALEREMGEVRESIQADRRDDRDAAGSGEERPLRFWHVGAGIGIVIATIAVLKFFGRLQ